ncbi:MAG TPA: DNA topoisomerase (ATP-hydrolyzing) [Egibacteraceae bacterium]|nr:DNA topoisomerase (ATP-hydrolyzing) [Egibacteraceae bacterium]
MSTQPTLLDMAANGGDGIVEVDIADRMEQSFLDYSMSVIVGRALPDVRDGLKPVQRRILYSMWEAGLRPDRPYRKCASAVGDVMKKYHPHGDSSIYEALVRMAQDFSTREPLVDGHGNFGSVDGDPPAAMRYTEARLSALAMELLEGIDEDTVDYAPNYDGYEQEPVILPARVPNLLVNGASGIAVGMATNIAPHNLGETIDACLKLIAKPDAAADELLAIMPAPDFPTGGRIVDGPGLRDAFLLGRGAITMEAVASTETRSGGLPRIVVTEIPYQVNKATLLERIADLVKERKVEEIRDLRDESSRDGMRIVIELKRGEDPGRVLGKLYRASDLRTNFNVNLVALVDGEPRTLGVRECLVEYLAHQRQVLTRRTTHRRDKAAARAHVLEGLLVALDHLDEVIALIRAADSADEARGQLIEHYSLSEVQATAILDMQLRRLARLEREKLAAEHRDLAGLIADLEGILADPAKLDGLLAGELRQLKARHANPRRSQIVGRPADGASGSEPDAGGRGASERNQPAMRGAAAHEAAVPELQAQLITVYVSAGGYLKAVPRRRVSKPHANPKDALVAVVRARSDETLLLVDADGGGYRIALDDVPVVTMRQRGVTVAELLGDGPDAPLVGAIRLGRDVDSVVTVSGRGLVKRTDRAEYEGRTRAMIAAGVRDDDALVGLAACGETDQLMLAHSGGQVIRFPASAVRPMGRAAAGVSGITVPAGECVVALSVLIESGPHEVITVDADGRAKRTPADEYPVQGRGGKGVQAGAEPMRWCGAAADLHLPAGGLPDDIEGRVVEPSAVAVAKRAARGADAVPPFNGRVVPEPRAAP